MSKYLLIPMLLLGVVFWDSTVFAEQITVQQAVNMALNKNEDIKKAEQDLKKSDYMYKEALSNAMPKIDGQIRYLRNIYTKSATSDMNMDMSSLSSASMDTMPYQQFPPYAIPRTDSSIINLSNGLAGLNNGVAKMVNGLGSTLSQFDKFAPQFSPQDNDVSAQILMTQPLYVGGKVGTALKIAKVYKEMSLNIYQDKKDSLVKEVKKSFYNVLILKEVSKVLHSSQDLASKHLDVIKNMYKNGLVSEYDLSKAKVNIMKINPEVVDADNNLIMAKTYLKIMIGNNIMEDLDVTGDMNSISPDLNCNFMQNAVENNSQLQNLKYLEKILEYNVDIENGGHLPTIVAVGAYNFISKNSDLSKTFDDTYAIHNISVGIQVNVPIFSGGNVTAKANQAKVEYEKTALLYNKVTKLVQLQAQNAYKNILVAKERLKLQDETHKEASKALEIAQVRFNNGLGTQLDLLDAQNSLKQVDLTRLSIQKELIDAELDYVYIIKQKGE